jgi:hypothetical protein
MKSLPLVSLETLHSSEPCLTTSANMRRHSIHYLYIIFLVSQATVISALRRTPGPQDDIRFQRLSATCHGLDPQEYSFGKCSSLISCIYDEFPEAMKQSLANGASIVALLPTILALIGKLNKAFRSLGHGIFESNYFAKVHTPGNFCCSHIPHRFVLWQHAALV